MPDASIRFWEEMGLVHKGDMNITHARLVAHKGVAAFMAAVLVVTMVLFCVVQQARAVEDAGSDSPAAEVPEAAYILGSAPNLKSTIEVKMSWAGATKAAKPGDASSSVLQRPYDGIDHNPDTQKDESVSVPVITVTDTETGQLLQENTNYWVSWTSTAPGGVSVNAGTYGALVIFNDAEFTTDSSPLVTVSLQYTITQIDISSANADVAVEAWAPGLAPGVDVLAAPTYTGSNLAPNIVVKQRSADYSERYEAGVDYNVDEYVQRYVDATQAGQATAETTALFFNQIADAGAYRIKVEGTGNLTGTRWLDYRVLPKSLGGGIVQAEGVSISVADVLSYNDVPVEPAVTVSYGSASLVSTSAEFAENFEIEYKDNTSAGYGYVIVKGKNSLDLSGTGNYTGTTPTFSDTAVYTGRSRPQVFTISYPQAGSTACVDGAVYFRTLQGAADSIAANKAKKFQFVDSTIALVRDAVGAMTLDSEQAVTVDLAGHTVSGSATAGVFTVSYAAAVLTVVNSVPASGGVSSDELSPMLVNQGGTVHVSGGTWSGAAAIANTSGTLSFEDAASLSGSIENGGTFNASGSGTFENPAGGAVLVNKGTAHIDGGVWRSAIENASGAAGFSVSGGTFGNASGAAALVNRAAAEIVGGTWTSPVENAASARTLTVSGGSFDVAAAPFTVNGGTLEFSAGALPPEVRAADGAANLFGDAIGGTVVVRAGKFSGLFCAAYAGKLSIFGGEYSSIDAADYLDASKALVQENAVVPWYKVAEATSIRAKMGKLGYRSVKAAVDVAPGTKTEIDLFQVNNEYFDEDSLMYYVAESVVIPEGKTIVLDLNGIKLAGDAEENPSEGAWHDTITNYGTLTIEDSSRDGIGTISNENEGSAALVNMPGGTMTLNAAGEIKSARWHAIRNLGALSVASNVVAIAGNDTTSTVLNGRTPDSTDAANRATTRFEDGEDDGKVTFSEGRFLGGSFSGGTCAVENTVNGKLEIKGGSFTAKSAGSTVLRNAGEVKITGGTFAEIDGDSPVVVLTGTGTLDIEDTVDPQDASAPVTRPEFTNGFGVADNPAGGLFAFEDYTGSKSDALHISGGVFNGTIGAVLAGATVVDGGLWLDRAFDAYTPLGMCASAEKNVSYTGTAGAGAARDYYSVVGSVSAATIEGSAKTGADGTKARVVYQGSSVAGLFTDTSLVDAGEAQQQAADALMGLTWRSGTGAEPRLLRYGTDFTVRFKDVDGATVPAGDPDGALVDAGSYTLVVDGAGAYEGTRAFELEVAPLDIGTFGVSVEPGTFTYTGAPQQPQAVRLYSSATCDEQTLISEFAGNGEANYTYTVSEDTQGAFTISVEGAGNYTGTCEVACDIAPIDLSATVVRFAEHPDGEPFDWTGKAVNPEVRLVFADDGADVPDVLDDCTLEYYRVRVADLSDEPAEDASGDAHEDAPDDSDGGASDDSAEPDEANGQAADDMEAISADEVVDEGTYRVVVRANEGSAKVSASQSATFEISAETVLAKRAGAAAGALAKLVETPQAQITIKDKLGGDEPALDEALQQALVLVKEAREAYGGLAAELERLGRDRDTYDTVVTESLVQALVEAEKQISDDYSAYAHGLADAVVSPGEYSTLDEAREALAAAQQAAERALGLASSKYMAANLLEDDDSVKAAVDKLQSAADALAAVDAAAKDIDGLQDALNAIDADEETYQNASAKLDAKVAAVEAVRKAWNSLPEAAEQWAERVADYSELEDIEGAIDAEKNIRSTVHDLGSRIDAFAGRIAGLVDAARTEDASGATPGLDTGACETLLGEIKQAREELAALDAQQQKYLEVDAASEAIDAAKGELDRIEPAKNFIETVGTLYSGTITTANEKAVADANAAYDELDRDVKINNASVKLVSLVGTGTSEQLKRVNERLAEAQGQEISKKRDEGRETAAQARNSLKGIRSAEDAGAVDASERWAHAADIEVYNQAIEAYENVLNDDKPNMTLGELADAAKAFDEAQSTFNLSVRPGTRTVPGRTYSGYLVTSVSGNAGTVTFQQSAAAGKGGTVTVPPTVPIAGKTFKVTKIADRAFATCRASQVVIGGNVTEIGSGVFAGAATVSSITVGPGVAKIAGKAFAQAKSVKTVTIASSKLAKKSALRNFLKGSKVKTVKVTGMKSKAKKKVKKAVKKWGGKKKVKVK